MLATVFFVPVQQQAKQIPNEAVKCKRSQYKVFHEGMTWRIAKEHCESLGGHLVRIESKSEQEFIARHLSKTNLSTGYWMEVMTSE